MTWVEIGYKSLMWKIKLKWKNGTLIFYKGWYDFVKAGKLRNGDICVFQSTQHPQKFQVAVFERRNLMKFNNAGVQQGKSLMKWIKVMTYETILSGEMKMFLKYNVAKDYVLFFDYVGRSHFYVSIFNQDCFDILDGMSDKIMLTDVLNWSQCPVVVISSDSSDSGSGIHNFNSIMVSSLDVSNETLSNASNAEEEYDLLHENDEAKLATFTVVLKASHVDKKGHGVSWRNGAVITLVWGELNSKVEVHRRRRSCRFRYGWDTFTSKVELVEGQVLEFVYRKTTHLKFITYLKMRFGQVNVDAWCLNACTKN
ncbi:hypothetical protein POM88_046105 [Heracleum sosnowskyi]|uniref:TF-B3 domain-containing protein n=1 Tax=Heracleum sosnowskyi TaxID=360622 RepID=A0AAD8H891_9APIA|nr:hypothetical protein POM88_046105 [Heracleum sosnowskyi]